MEKDKKWCRGGQPFVAPTQDGDTDSTLQPLFKRYKDQHITTIWRTEFGAFRCSLSITPYAKPGNELAGKPGPDIKAPVWMPVDPKFGLDPMVQVHTDVAPAPVPITATAPAGGDNAGPGPAHPPGPPPGPGPGIPEPVKTTDHIIMARRAIRKRANKRRIRTRLVREQWDV